MSRGNRGDEREGEREEKKGLAAKQTFGVSRRVFTRVLVTYNV